MDFLHENHTYEFIELPKGKKALQNKWVYKIKTVDGEPKYKVRLFLKDDYARKEVIDFQELFSHVIMITLRILFHVTVALDLELHRMDVRLCSCMVICMKTVNEAIQTLGETCMFVYVHTSDI